MEAPSEGGEGIEEYVKDAGSMAWINSGCGSSRYGWMAQEEGDGGLMYEVIAEKGAMWLGRERKACVWVFGWPNIC